MYKVGDRLLCKKDYYFEKNIIFSINKYYTVDKYKPVVGYNFFVIDNDGDKIGFDYTEGTKSEHNRHYLKYFYTLDEIRTMKLERLNSV